MLNFIASFRASYGSGKTHFAQAHFAKTHLARSTLRGADMPSRIDFAAGAAILGVLACLDGGFDVQAKDLKQNAGDHASLRSYPDAVLSVTVAASGVVVTVAANGTTLVAKNAAGDVLWRADVLKLTGTPSTGFPVVRNLSISDRGSVSIVVGKHRYVEADLKSGALKLLGED